MKITQKQYGGYLKAKRELLGISFNDGYNVATYGIDRKTYCAIGKAISNINGICGDNKIDVNVINKELELI